MLVFNFKPSTNGVLKGLESNMLNSVNKLVAKEF
jgi:hypothetical protein